MSRLPITDPYLPADLRTWDTDGPRRCPVFRELPRAEEEPGGLLAMAEKVADALDVLECLWACAPRDEFEKEKESAAIGRIAHALEMTRLEAVHFAEFHLRKRRPL